MIYKELQRKKQIDLIKKSKLFDNAEAGEKYRGIPRDFILKDGEYNLYESIREDVNRYFSNNGIQWWGGMKPTGHVLSSQIACINHLFPIRSEHDILLQILNDATNMNFEELRPIPNWLDKKEEKNHYVAFEAISERDRLNEVKIHKDGSKGHLTRGSNCTSVDALMIAKNTEGVWLIPIEWKYTEQYDYKDKSNEKGKGEERLRRYKDLIQNSTQLNKKYDDYQGTIYFQEPYYQLMRQTLWAELSLEDYGANKFLHLHVVPEANKELLNCSYKQFHQFKDGMEKTWCSLLKNPNLYLCKDSKTIFDSVKSFNPDLYNYLFERYWRD